MEKNKFAIGEDSTSFPTTTGPSTSTTTNIQRTASGNGTKRFKKGHIKRRSSGKLTGPKYFMRPFASTENIPGGIKRAQSQQSFKSTQLTSLTPSEKEDKINENENKESIKVAPSPSSTSTTTTTTTTSSSATTKSMDHALSRYHSSKIAPLKTVSSITNMKSISTPEPSYIMTCAKPFQQSLHVVVSNKKDNSSELTKDDLSTSKRISSLKYLQNYSLHTTTLHDDHPPIKENQQQKTSYFLYNDIDYYDTSSSSSTFNPIYELTNEYQTIRQYYNPMKESLLRCMNKLSSSSLSSSSFTKKKKSRLSPSPSSSSSTSTSASTSTTSSSSSDISHTPIQSPSSPSFHHPSAVKLKHHLPSHHDQLLLPQDHYSLPSSAEVNDCLLDPLQQQQQQQQQQHHHHHDPHAYQRKYIHKIHMQKQLLDHYHHPIVNTDESYSFSNHSNSYGSYWMSTLWSRVKNGLIKYHH